MRERPTVENGIAEFKRAMIEAGETMAKRAGEIMADLAAALAAEQAMTIVEFILARVADDEAAATRVVSCPEGRLGCLVMHYETDARVLAECAAYRRIVEEYLDILGMIPAHVQGDGDEHEAIIAEWCEATTLRSLAAIWAGHESYDPEWRTE